MKQLFVSHRDTDGYGGTILAKYFNEWLNFDEFMTLDYGFEKDSELINYMKTFDLVVIADLTFPEEVASQFPNLIVFDHHEATEWITKLPGSAWSTNECGTSLFFRNYVLSKVPIEKIPPVVFEFVALTRVYDTWQKTSSLWPIAKDLNNVFYGIKNYKAVSDDDQSARYVEVVTSKFDKATSWFFTSAEQEIIQRANDKEEKVYQEVMHSLDIRYDSEGLVFGVCRMASKISVVANRILEEQPSLSYIIIFNVWGGLNGSISFRSLDPFDCTTLGIAEGHKQAAGSVITIEQCKLFLENQDYCLRYKDEIFNREDPGTFFLRLV